MHERTAILHLVKAAVEDLHGDLQGASLRNVDASTTLFAETGPLDSLALVRLVADLELRIEDTLGESIVLADEKAMSRGNPYRTVGTIVDLILDRLTAVHV